MTLMAPYLHDLDGMSQGLSAGDVLLNPHDGLCSDEAVARETRLTLDEAQAAPVTGGRAVCEASGVVPTWLSHFVCTCVYVRVCV